MCTKEEVRDVVRSESPSKLSQLILNVLLGGLIALLGWLLWAAHQQDTTLLNMKRVNEVSLARLAGKVDILATNLNNIKEVAIDRSKDRWTGRDAANRNALMDERCANMNIRITRIEGIVEDLSKGRIN